MVEETNYSSWYVNEQDFRQMETMQIDKVHDGPETGFDDDEIDDEEPYFANPDDKVNSPRITGITAISIVRRITYFDLKTLGTYLFFLLQVSQYCQTLPSDRFTKLLPFFELKEDEHDARTSLMAGLGFSGFSTSEKFKYVLHMPHLTPYREPIVGDPRASKVAAKRRAALDMCKLLHEDGFLDDHLLPKKRLLEEFIDELDVGNSKRPKIGTKRSKKFYEIGNPLNLKNNDEKFLYVINSRLVKTSMHTANVKQYAIYDPAISERKIGFIAGQNISNHLRKPFTIYTLSGELEVQIEKLCGSELKTLFDNPDLVNLTKKFHVKSLQDVIGFDCEMNITDAENDDILMVPIKDSQIGKLGLM